MVYPILTNEVLSNNAVQLKLKVVTATFEDAKFNGLVGAVKSVPGAIVVTDSGLLAADLLPDASDATTVIV